MNTDINNTIIFKLQKRFLYVEMLFFSSITSLCIISLFPAIFSILAYETIIPSAIRAAIFLNITAFILFMLSRIIKTEIQSFSIALTDDKIIKKGFFNTVSIQYSEITGFRYIKNMGFQRYLKISAVNNAVLIPLSIDKPIVFVDILKSRMSKSILNPNSLLDPRFHEDLKVFYDSYNRSLAAFHPLIIISIFLFFFNFVIAAQFWDLALIPVLLFAITGFIIPIVTYAIANNRIKKSLRNLLRSESPEIHNANVEYLYSGLLMFIFYLSFGIFFKAIFL